MRLAGFTGLVILSLGVAGYAVGVYLKDVLLAFAEGKDFPAAPKVTQNSAPAFARKAIDDSTEGWNTFSNALRKILRAPGYSQWPLAAVMRNLDAARKVRDELDRLNAAFPGTSARINNRAMLAFRMPEGRRYDHRPYLERSKRLPDSTAMFARGTNEALN